MFDESKRKNLKIAWLLNSGFYYWHPLIAYFAELWPNTKLFTVNWRGYVAGYEDSFEVETLGEKRIITLKKIKGGYDYIFSYLPLNIIAKLLTYKPQVIFSNSFGLWTILALLFKPIGRWRVGILHEGCSPNVDYRNSQWRLFLRRTMMKLADGCLTNGELGRDYLTKVLQTSSEKVFVYPYPMPSNKTFIAAAPVPQLANLKHPVFLFVGSIVPRKGLDFLLQAAALLEDKRTLDYTILVVGDGEEKPQLEAYCQKNNLTQKVYWAGQVEYDRLGAYFQAADIFIFPTLEDVWAVVVLEAMMAGKAILCSQFAGAVEMIQPGENGYVINPNDVKDLSEKMQKFIEDRELATIMGQKSQAIMNQYSPEGCAKLISELLELMVDRKGG
jgi:glycosyltransferase involved in cell wall biosynthesis